MFKSSRFILFIFLCFFYSFGVNGQFNIRGVVVDENEEPIPFANVIFSGTKIGTLTNFDGEFQLNSSSKMKELTVQLLGYQTQKIRIKNKN